VVRNQERKCGKESRKKIVARKQKKKEEEQEGNDSKTHNVRTEPKFKNF
jgi:hypothetical protein